LLSEEIRKMDDQVMGWLKIRIDLMI
jgi:hypothetical protein